MKKQMIGLLMICIGAACADSEWLWVPLILCGIGSALALKKDTLQPASNRRCQGKLLTVELYHSQTRYFNKHRYQKGLKR